MLDKVIDKGGTFKFFDDPLKTANKYVKGKEGLEEGLNFFGREIEYLEKRGYEVTDEIAKPKSKSSNK